LPKIDIAAALKRFGTAYPAPYDKPCEQRARAPLGDAAGLDQFGVNLLTLQPGVWSSQRHWHSHEDEFCWVVEGEVVLIDETGETVLRAGDCAGFKAGVANGHHLVNRSDRVARVLEVGTRNPVEDACDYPDIDMVARPDEDFYRRRDGMPYPTKA
jgi:uncharacterized cupin superfamily protein